MLTKKQKASGKLENAGNAVDTSTRIYVLLFTFDK